MGDAPPEVRAKVDEIERELHEWADKNTIGGAFSEGRYAPAVIAETTRRIAQDLIDSRGLDARLEAEPTMENEQYVGLTLSVTGPHAALARALLFAEGLNDGS
jgi:hypothetical protein